MRNLHLSLVGNSESSIYRRQMWHVQKISTPFGGTFLWR